MSENDVEQYPQIHLDNQLCFTLYTASRLMTQLYAPLLKELEITYPQYLVFMVLWENLENGQTGLTVRDLGELLLLDSGTLSPLLKRLEANGFLQRIRSSHDERQVQVQLTEKGSALREKAKGIPTTLICQIGREEDALFDVRDQLKNLIVDLSKAVKSSGS